jgi:hypothetical protein
MPGLWLLIGYLLVALVLVASLIPAPPGLETISDKILHLLAYVALALWFGAIYGRSRFLALGLCLLALGAVIEFLQFGTGYRSFELRTCWLTRSAS